MWWSRKSLWDTAFTSWQKSLHNSVIRKSSGDINNIGRVRIDTYLDKDPEVFTYSLRAYIRHNVLLDLARKYGYNAKHTEQDTVCFEEDEESINKVDSVNYNKNQIENGVDIADQVVSEITFKDDMYALVDTVIDRFSARKPVAGYIFLCMLNECYDARTVVADLKSKDLCRENRKSKPHMASQR